MAHQYLESKVEARLFRGVKSRGGVAVKIYRKPGFPDRIIHMPGGKVVWVELKRPGGTLAEHQVVAHTLIRGLGGAVVTLHSYEEVDAFLGGL